MSQRLDCRLVVTLAALNTLLVRMVSVRCSLVCCPALQSSSRWAAVNTIRLQQVEEAQADVALSISRTLAMETNSCNICVR